ncbi:AGC protein kinase [Phytophthora nicotianae]|uniref:AGC protein kinase n=3 Tax=Phytophthora nicotianae TaxID=4792 RepID=W2RGM7_PHYN3|nr:AGC protein kinase [Phytophthora nicotianae INRA-310]ETM03470.1 AGC protein kinase [Phytophthora nicotianae]ETM56739.1 AGC protein kinase [Phytophthora nicotianae]ETN23774.1 AGC protein kinase [Phytophthora nicotianae INRA-310]ETO86040.1 AGC protein kinase [Phytophthora nicotianae P1976]
MPAGASVVRRGSSMSARDPKMSVSTFLGPKDALTAEISSDNQEIIDAEDYITGASRGGYASSIISSEGSSDSEEGGAYDSQDVAQFSVAELQDQIGQQFVEGINPYVEQHMGDEEDFYVENSSSDEDENTIKDEKTPEEKEKELTEWENPSYLVKDLDTGESYRVEEIDQQFTLVTLDSVAAQHEHKEEQQQGEETTESTSSYLLSLYTADETADIEIEDDLPQDAEAISTGGSMRARSSNMSVIYAPSDELPTGPPVKCNFSGCTEMHQRVSGYCADHEMIAKEEEDSRAQALYLIPSGARAEFIKIGSHGFAYDASNRLYTVYAIEMRCVQSGATWVIYRRYQQFKELNDRLRPMGVRVPLLPPKKLLGSFEPDFIAKRQSELSNWLRCLLNYDRVDQSAKNPHLVEEVRKFLTSKADQPPLLLDRLPLKRSRFFGASLADDGDDENNRLSTGKQNVSLQDFKMIQVIGRGSFGKVVLVGHKTTKKLYAMKILSKENIVKRKQVEHTRTERRVLGCTRHPFIVGLHYAFQTAQRLYFVLDYCPGGELFYHLSRMKKLPEHMACFYAAEITLALEHLHGLGVVYRDLKPENILLTKDGHIKLADFGLAKEGIRDGVNGTNSLCGTPEYLPPEILDRLGHGTAVDWWNLGMVLYEMLTGLPPWYTNDRKKLFERLRSARLHFPPYVSRRAEALIRQLLNRNPAERLGSKGAHQVKNHLFFESIDWAKLAKKQATPPFRPCHSAMNDGEAPLNFEAEFTRLPLPSAENVATSPQSGRLGALGTRLRRDSDTFKDFTYESPGYLESVAKKEEA